jgi:L-rhamnose isomerase
VDSVEPKLFGGKLRGRLARVLSRLRGEPEDSADSGCGHYHPTEGIEDKISSVLIYLPEIALHVSRGVRWDSDHVVTLPDELQAIAQEIVWAGTLVACASDWIISTQHHRVAAWVIGAQHDQGAVAGARRAGGQAEKAGGG